MRTGLIALFALGAAGAALAQVQHLPRGAATDITAAEIDAAVKKTASLPVSDQQLRVLSINNEYNVGVGVVHRARTNGQGAPGAGGGVEHSEISEIYHVISGSATLVTGGTISGAKPVAGDNQVVTTLNGPSTNGGPVVGGTSRKLGPGDVVIIPPNTPHWFSEIASDQIVYLVVRADPKKVLPAGFVLK